METTSLQTLDALEERLRRVDFLLHGSDLEYPSAESTAHEVDGSQSIASRLQSLERSLQAVLSHSDSAAELLQLQYKHPHVWGDPAAQPEDIDMSESALASLVLSHTPSYHATTARLTSLNDLPVPNASSSVSLVSLEPRIRNAIQRQEQQQHELGKLRQRSVQVVARWYELGIVGMGDCWSEWESRLMKAETRVRRAEGKKNRDMEGL